MAVALLLLALVSDFGCSPVSDTSAVVVTVNGVSLRQREVKGRADMMAALHRHRYPQTSENVLQRVRRQYESGYPCYWVEDVVLSQYAASEKLTVSDAVVKKCMQQAFEGLKAKGDRTIDDLMKVPGVCADYLTRQIRAEALRQVVADHFFEQNPTNIPDSYVDEQLANIRDYNARMVLTNAFVYARATNVWNRLKAGEDFVKLVREETEADAERGDNGLWGIFDLADLSKEPELQAALGALKPGEFTPPVEGDNGLMIARLNEVDDSGGLEISRIVFRLPLFYAPAPREKILAAAYDKYRKSLFGRKLKELLKNAVIQYEQEVQTTKKESK